MKRRRAKPELIKPEAYRKQLLQAIEGKLIPWTHNGHARVMLVDPPFKPTEGIRITPSRTPLLRTNARPGAIVNDSWIEEGLNSSCYISLCCVLEGEIDWCIGVTNQMARRTPEISKQYGRYTLRIPEGTFFLMPPGIPYDDGRHPHWVGENFDEVHSQIFWFNILPSGALIHLCSSRGTTHTSLPRILVKDEHINTLMELLADELHSSDSSTTIARGYLSLMLQRLLRAFTQSPHLTGKSESPNTLAQGTSLDILPNVDPSDAIVLQRARHYIQVHLSQRLNVQRIASQSYVSPAHLNRLFRRVLSTSPMHYVEECRLERAQQLLQDMNIPVREVGSVCGYRNPDVFSRAFSRRYGYTPTEFRKRYRTLPSAPNQTGSTTKAEKPASRANRLDLSESD